MRAVRVWRDPRRGGRIIYEKDSEFPEVPGVPIKGRTIWVIGSTLVVFIIVPRRDIEIFIKNKQCQQCQPAASQPVTWIELLETIFFSWSKMTICLINFPTKKLPVKVPSIVTTVSHSSLHWTLSLLSASCDKVKFKHPDFVEKFAMDGESAECSGALLMYQQRQLDHQGRPGQCPVKVLAGDNILTLWSHCTTVEISRNGPAELHGVNQANHQPPTPSASFQGVTKFLGLEWLVFIQSHWGEWSNLMAWWGYCETLQTCPGPGLDIIIITNIPSVF